MKTAFVIIDYGMGNIGSIRNMLVRFHPDVTISSDPDTIAGADKLILPGVGAFDEGMKNLEESGLIAILNKRVLEDKIPVLGICLGMQLFASGSEEGVKPGLNWLNADTVKFHNGNGRKIPHMGWNTIKKMKASRLMDDFDPRCRFYFVHSYHVVCRDKEDILAVTSYGNDFVSAVHRDNIYGTQFHPEKSHRFGMQLMNNFVNGV